MNIVQCGALLLAGMAGGVCHHLLLENRLISGDSDAAIVKVQRLVIVDKDGKTIGEWDGQGLRIFGPTSDSGATVQADSFVLTPGKGKARLALEVHTEDGARAYLSAGSDSSAIGLAADPTGGSTCNLRRPDGSEGVVLRASSHRGVERASVKLLDNDAKQRVMMSLEGDTASIATLDAKENVVAELKK